MDSEQIWAYLERIRLKDPLTRNHCGMAAEYAVSLGRMIELNECELEHLRQAAILHDIGKIKVPDEILLKPAALTDEEYEVMKCHPAWGADMLEEVAEEDFCCLRVADIVRHHHERYDGMGYPEGLLGEGIPLLAQIVAIADAFDAMTSDRPYRSGMSHSRAREILVKERGKQFHPILVDRFIELVAC